MAVTPLSELREWQLVEGGQDLRGRHLIDSSGKLLGRIDQMMVNTDAERVDSVRTENGDLFPVGALEIRSDAVVFHGVKQTGTTTANLAPDAYRIRRHSAESKP